MSGAEIDFSTEPPVEKEWEGDEPDVESVSGADPDAEARIGLAALNLGADLEAAQALGAGVPVPRRRLRPEMLAALGEPLDGEDLRLDDALALRVAVVLPLPGPADPSTDEDSAAPFQLEVLTARETCALPDPPADARLLGELVVRGYRTIIGGDTGAGKTTLGYALLDAICNGTDFLGFTGAGNARALVIDLEQGLRSVKRRLREAGLDQSDAIDYVRVPDGLRLDGDIHHIAALEHVLERGQYHVVVLDPHYKSHGADSNDERATVDLMRLLDRWREQHGFALILPTHTRKPPPGETKRSLTIHDLFGSSALVRGAEVVIALQLVHPGYSRLYFFKIRDGDDDLPVGGDPWGLLFDRDNGYRRDPNDTAPARDIEAEILDYVLAHPGATTNEISKGIEAGRKRVSDVLHGDARFTFTPGPNRSKNWVASDAENHPGHLREPGGDRVASDTLLAPLRGQGDRATDEPGGTDPSEQDLDWR